MGRSGLRVTLRKSASVSPEISGSKRSAIGSVSKGSGSRSAISSSPVRGVNLGKLKTMITDLSEYSTSRINNLPSVINEKLTEVGKLIEMIIESPSYEEIVEHIEETFKGQVPIPDTVGAFFYGCMASSTEPFKGELGCAAPCAGNVIPHGKFKQCSQNVFHLSDKGLDMRTSLEYGASDKAYIYCDTNYDGLTSSHIAELQALGINYVTIVTYDNNKYNTLMTNKPLTTLLNYPDKTPSPSKSILRTQKSKSLESEKSSASKSVSLVSDKQVNKSASVSASKSASVSASKSASVGTSKSASVGTSKSASVGTSKSVNKSRPVKYQKKHESESESEYEEYILELDSNDDNECGPDKHKAKSSSSYSCMFIIIAILFVVIIICAAIWLMRRYKNYGKTEALDDGSYTKSVEVVETTTVAEKRSHYGPGIVSC